MSPAGPGDRPLHGKVAVVTGGGRGIGRAIALAYAEAGAAVCCTARTREQIEDTADRIRGAGGTGIAVAADVTDPRAVERMFEEAAEALGGIDILVANAGGVLESKPVTEGDPALWEATVAVNLFGAYHCIRAAIPPPEAARRRQDPHPWGRAWGTTAWPDTRPTAAPRPPCGC